MLRSPRTKFRESTHADSFKKLVQSETIEEALNATLLELHFQMPFEGTPQASVDAHQQMVGARKFVDLLYQMPFPEEQVRKAPTKGLDYSSGV